MKSIKKQTPRVHKMYINKQITNVKSHTGQLLLHRCKEASRNVHM